LLRADLPLLTADAGFLAVLAEYDDVEGGAGEDAHGAQGVAETVGVATRYGGRSGRATGGWGEGRCTHVSMVADQA
jgi:hypothetical protein